MPEGQQPVPESLSVGAGDPPGGALADEVAQHAVLPGDQEPPLAVPRGRHGAARTHLLVQLDLAPVRAEHTRVPANALTDEEATVEGANQALHREVPLERPVLELEGARGVEASVAEAAPLVRHQQASLEPGEEADLGGEGHGGQGRAVRPPHAHLVGLEGALARPEARPRDHEPLLEPRRLVRWYAQDLRGALPGDLEASQDRPVVRADPDRPVLAGEDPQVLHAVEGVHPDEGADPQVHVEDRLELRQGQAAQVTVGGDDEDLAPTADELEAPDVPGPGVLLVALAGGVLGIGVPVIGALLIGDLSPARHHQLRLRDEAAVGEVEDGHVPRRGRRHELLPVAEHGRVPHPALGDLEDPVQGRPLQGPHHRRPGPPRVDQAVGLQGEREGARGGARRELLQAVAVVPGRRQVEPRLREVQVRVGRLEQVAVHLERHRGQRQAEGQGRQGDGGGGLPTAPAAQPQPAARRPRLDGFELADPPQVLGEGEGRGVAPVEVALHGGGEDHPHLVRDHRVGGHRVGQRRVEDGQGQVVGPLARERPLPRERLVQADPEGPHVGPRVVVPAAGREVLRGHVRRGAEHLALAGQSGATAGVALGHAREAEVQHHRLAPRGDHQVGGLDVPVDEALLVGRVQGAGGALEEAQHPRELRPVPRHQRELVRRRRPAPLPRRRDGAGQVLPLHVTHGDPRRLRLHVGVVHAGEPGVVEPGDALRLAPEPSAALLRDERGGHQLERDPPAEVQVHRQPHGPLPAGAELLLEPVVPDDPRVAISGRSRGRACRALPRRGAFDGRRLRLDPPGGAQELRRHRLLVARIARQVLRQRPGPAAGLVVEQLGEEVEDGGLLVRVGLGSGLLHPCRW